MATRERNNVQNEKCYFKIVLIVLILFTSFLLLNLWFNCIPKIYIDKYVLILVFTLIGLSLLPFAKKIKIANLLEFEALKEKIEKVDTNKYLGQVLQTLDGLYYYYDNNGKHRIPNKKTAEFLQSPLGIIQVSPKELDLLGQDKDPIEDIDKAEIMIWDEKHFFAILNNKKYWLSVTDLIDLNLNRRDKDRKYTELSDKNVEDKEYFNRYGKGR